MKKIVSFLLISAVFLCSLTFLVYYDKGADADADVDVIKDYKIGLGIYADVTAVDADGEVDGKVLAEYTFAALIIDEGGRVVDCELDASTYGDIAVASEGVTSVAKPIATKVTLGDAYGMSKTKEWYVQADNFENTVKGKTLDEIKNLMLTSGENAGKGTEDVINAGCTIYVSGFVRAIEKAFLNTKDVKLSETDVQLGVVVNSSGTNADGETNGSAKFGAVVTAAVKNDGKVVSCLTDESEIKLELTSSGSIEGKQDSYKTKRELGNDYGMSKSGMTEWYVQVDALDKACEGKTAEQIAALAVGGYGDEDIQAAGCTIYIGDLIKAAVDAAD